MPPQGTLAHENFFHSEGGHAEMRARSSRSRSRPAGARSERGGAALPDPGAVGARPGGRDANVVGEADDDRQAHVLREPRRYRAAGGLREVDAEGRAVAAFGTGPCRQADARRQVALRSEHRVGHHYLEMLAVIGERYPDGLPGTVPLVCLNRPGAGLANREAYLVEQ